MRLRKGVIAAFAALLCGGYMVSAEPGTASAQTVPQFGFASLAQITSASDLELNASAAAVKAVGASWVRLGAAWNHVEPRPGIFDWSNVDAAVLAARANGTKVLFVLTGPAPYWAQSPPGDPSSGSATPAKPATFAKFASAAATRYKDHVSTWEIWNEPNTSEVLSVAERFTLHRPSQGGLSVDSRCPA